MVELVWPLEGLAELAAAGDWSKIDELRSSGRRHQGNAGG